MIVSAIVICIMFPYLMFGMGDTRRTVFKAENIEDYYNGIMNMYNENNVNYSQYMIFSSNTAKGDLRGTIMVYSGTKLPSLTGELNISGVEQANEYLFSPIYSDKATETGYTPDGYSGYLYFYNSEEDIVIQVLYSFKGALYYLSPLGSFYTFRSYSYEDIINSSCYVRTWDE